MTTKSAAAAARATVYGYPRQGQSRELKKAIEGYWKGRVTANALQDTAAELRRSNWRQLADAGIHEVPTGDFSYYDHVLDTSVMVGAIPARQAGGVVRGNPVGIRDCPAAVSGNDRRHTHWARPGLGSDGQ